MKDELLKLIAKKDKELNQQYEKLKQLEDEYAILVEMLKQLEGKK